MPNISRLSQQLHGLRPAPEEVVASVSSPREYFRSRQEHTHRCSPLYREADDPASVPLPSFAELTTVTSVARQRLSRRRGRSEEESSSATEGMRAEVAVAPPSQQQRQQLVQRSTYPPRPWKMRSPVPLSPADVQEDLFDEGKPRADTPQLRHGEAEPRAQAEDAPSTRMSFRTSMAADNSDRYNRYRAYAIPQEQQTQSMCSRPIQEDEEEGRLAITANVAVDAREAEWRCAPLPSAPHRPLPPSQEGAAVSPSSVQPSKPVCVWVPRCLARNEAATGRDAERVHLSESLLLNEAEGREGRGVLHSTSQGNADGSHAVLWHGSSSAVLPSPLSSTLWQVTAYEPVSVLVPGKGSPLPLVPSKEGCGHDVAAQERLVEGQPGSTSRCALAESVRVCESGQRTAGNEDADDDAEEGAGGEAAYGRGRRRAPTEVNAVERESEAAFAGHRRRPLPFSPPQSFAHDGVVDGCTSADIGKVRAAAARIDACHSLHPPRDALLFLFDRSCDGEAIDGNVVPSTPVRFGAAATVAGPAMHITLPWMLQCSALPCETAELLRRHLEAHIMAFAGDPTAEARVAPPPALPPPSWVSAFVYTRATQQHATQFASQLVVRPAREGKAGERSGSGERMADWTAPCDDPHEGITLTGVSAAQPRPVRGMQGVVPWPSWVPDVPSSLQLLTALTSAAFLLVRDVAHALDIAATAAAVPCRCAHGGNGRDDAPPWGDTARTLDEFHKFCEAVFGDKESKRLCRHVRDRVAPQLLDLGDFVSRPWCSSAAGGGVGRQVRCPSVLDVVHHLAHVWMGECFPPLAARLHEFLITHDPGVVLDGLLAPRRGAAVKVEPAVEQEAEVVVGGPLYVLKGTCRAEKDDPRLPQWPICPSQAPRSIAVDPLAPSVAAADQAVRWPPPLPPSLRARVYSGIRDFVHGVVHRWERWSADSTAPLLQRNGGGGSEGDVAVGASNPAIVMSVQWATHVHYAVAQSFQWLLLNPGAAASVGTSGPTWSPTSVALVDMRALLELLALVPTLVEASALRSNEAEAALRRACATVMMVGHTDTATATNEGGKAAPPPPQRQWHDDHDFESSSAVLSATDGAIIRPSEDQVAAHHACFRVFLGLVSYHATRLRDEEAVAVLSAASMGATPTPWPSTQALMDVLWADSVLPLVVGYVTSHVGVSAVQTDVLAVASQLVWYALRLTQVLRVAGRQGTSLATPSAALPPKSSHRHRKRCRTPTQLKPQRCSWCPATRTGENDGGDEKDGSKIAPRVWWASSREGTDRGKDDHSSPSAPLSASSATVTVTATATRWSAVSEDGMPAMPLLGEAATALLPSSLAAQPGQGGPDPGTAHDDDDAADQAAGGSPLPPPAVPPHPCREDGNGGAQRQQQQQQRVHLLFSPVQFFGVSDEERATEEATASSLSMTAAAQPLSQAPSGDWKEPCRRLVRRWQQQARSVSPPAPEDTSAKTWEESAGHQLHRRDIRRVRAVLVGLRRRIAEVRQACDATAAERQPKKDGESLALAARSTHTAPFDGAAAVTRDYLYGVLPPGLHPGDAGLLTVTTAITHPASSVSSSTDDGEEPDRSARAVHTSRVSNSTLPTSCSSRCTGVTASTSPMVSTVSWVSYSSSSQTL